MNQSGKISGFLKPALLVIMLAATALQTTDASENNSSHVRLLRLEGSSSKELSASFDSPDHSETPGFTLRDARLDADSMAFLTRLRSVLTIHNAETGQRITEVEWQLDIHDEALRSLSHRVLQTQKLNIYPGETGAASAKLGAILPDRMIVLLQLVRVSFADGSAWLAPVQCGLGEDLRTVSCGSR
ncbi:MAG: hypothetical protein WAU45_23770 [Blastocatellia bacterium]